MLMAKYNKNKTTEFKIVSPFFDEVPEPVEEAQSLLSTEDIIDGKHFERGIITAIDRPFLTIRNCIFSQNFFIECKLKSAQISDVRFENCDLSNMSLASGSFHRVEFVSCKLVGTNLSETTMNNVLFKDCNAHYINLSMSKFTQVKFAQCDLKSGNLNENRLNGVIYESCSLVEADFSHTSLRNIDLKTSHIEGIQLNIADLKGAIVTSLQAMDLISLLGIIIDDD